MNKAVVMKPYNNSLQASIMLRYQIATILNLR